MSDSIRMNRTSSSRNNSNSNKQDSLEEIVNEVSNHLDTHMYQPIYERYQDSYEISIAATIKEFYHPNFFAITKKLRNIKVICASCSVLFLGYALQSFALNRRLKTIIYGALFMDLFRMSYNCYLPRYASSIMKKMGGSIGIVSDAFFRAIQSAVGISSGDSSTMDIIRKDILWDLIIKDTFVIKIWSKVSILVFPFLLFFKLYDCLGTREFEFKVNILLIKGKAILHIIRKVS